VNGFVGAVSVVIGGASGIGAAIAERFAEEGATVVVADIDDDGASARATALGAPAWAHAVQVTGESSVGRLFDEVVAKEGRLDCVVNCAGVNAVAAITDMDAADWERVLDVSLTGAFLVVKQAALHMAGTGSIITIGSLNARQPAAGMSAYCAAKAGVSMLTEVAALELGPRGIRVNAISPGLVDTPLVGPLFAIPGMQAEFLDNTPLGRIGTPGDIADAALFLSAPNSWITGETLNVNGGAHTRRYPDVLASLQRSTR
jgi:3-oxoacyl-[acyl-carrier protein] reductase